MQRAYEKGIKQISVIDMASKEIRKLANKQEGKQANKKEDKQAKGQTKRWCPRGTNVGLDRMSIASLY